MLKRKRMTMTMTRIGIRTDDGNKARKMTYSHSYNWQQPSLLAPPPQLKAVLLVVTLISFYYHGFTLIISCSFLNPGSSVNAVGIGGIGTHHHQHHHHRPNHNDNDDYGEQYHHHHSTNQDEFADLDEQLKHEHEDHEKEEESANAKLKQNRKLSPFFSSLGIELESQVSQQANDILTKLKHSQGRTHEGNNEYEHAKENANSANQIRFVGKAGRYYKSDGVGDEDDNDDNMTVSNLHMDLLQIVKRYALLNGKNAGIDVGIGTGAVGKLEVGRTNNHNQVPSSSSTPSVPVTCKDESGNDVSWFIAYKLPRIDSSSDPLIKEGSKYHYILPSGSSWTTSQYAINDERSLLGTTLQLMWTINASKAGTEDDIARVLYNDQPPNKPAIVINGHTKGLIISSSAGGLWLQHSCPHFPDSLAENFSSSYPSGGLINGQMFFCMSLANTKDVDSIGSVLQYTRPLVYNYSISNGLGQLLPQLTKVAEKNATVRNAPWFCTFDMATSGNGKQLELKVFAKGPKFRKEIYSSWVAIDYGVSLAVQSWLNGLHPFMSNCTSDKFPVYNVMMKNLGGQNFSYIDDHSKWAVSLTEDKPLTCIGDLNRMKPQKTRGGVTICMTDKQIWTAFKTLVEDTQPCNSTTLKNYVLKNHKRMFSGK